MIERSAVFAALGITVTFIAAGGARAGPSPNTVCHRLKTRPFPTATLPTGFRPVKVSGQCATPGADQTYVGWTRVTFGGPDNRDEIFFDTFTTASAARAAFEQPDPDPSPVHRVGPLPGFRDPSGLFEGSLGYGFSSLAAIVRGNVSIAVVADARTQATARRSARKLLAAGYRQLLKVRVR